MPGIKSNVFYTTVKSALLIVATFCMLGSSAKNSKPYRDLYIPLDSMPNALVELWRYHKGDNPNYKAPEFDDSDWDLMETYLYNTKKQTFFKDKIGWFRVHFKVDKKAVLSSLAIAVKQQGASEIYLDGKLIKAFGSIGNAENSVYYNPLEMAVPIRLEDTLMHVLAVRYANFKAFENFHKFKNNNSGFEFLIGEATDLNERQRMRDVVMSTVTTGLGFIFFTLCLIHILMFFYYKALKTNLYFSIFMFTLGCSCIAGYVSFFSNTPLYGYWMGASSLFLFVIGSVSLSAFVHEVCERKKRTRLYIWVGIGLLLIIMRLMHIPEVVWGLLVLIFGVIIEAIILIGNAIYRRIKGAKIIGFGILFFTLFILFILLALIISDGSFDINDSNPLGRIILLIAFFAILSIPISMSVYLAWNFAFINRNLALQLVEIKSLSEKNLQQELEKKKLLENRKEELEAEVAQRTAEVVAQKQEIELQNAQLTIEKQKSDDLLLNILPEEIADELKLKGEITAQQYDEVTVLFTDFVNFTGISAQLSPKELVYEIHQCFKAFDAIMERHNLEKIKTIGDAYLAVCGLPQQNAQHAENTIRAAIDIIDYIKKRKAEGGLFEIRIGINTGSVVAGIVGVKKFAYDIWGDTVNTAARMEQNSLAGKINISGTTYERVKDHFKCIHRGKVNAKNKGEIDMYFVEH